MEHPESHSLKTYVCVAYYYLEVLMAFIQEVKDDLPRADKTWRSAHLDYHFAMGIHNSAFTEDMQNATLSKINRTWADFRKKKVYRPVQLLNIDTYHETMCKGKNMCGVPSNKHLVSVEDMISATVKPQHLSTTTVVAPDTTEKRVRFNRSADTHQQRHASSTTRTIKTTVESISSTSEIERDDIDEAADMFEMKANGPKSRKNVKGGRREKELLGNATTGRKAGMGRSSRPHRNTNSKGTGESVTQDDNDDVYVNAAAHPMGTGKKIVECDDEPITRSSSSAVHLQPRASRPVRTKGKQKAILESENEYESSNDATYGTSDIISEDDSAQAKQGVPALSAMRSTQVSDMTTTTQIRNRLQPDLSSSSITGAEEIPDIYNSNDCVDDNAANIKDLYDSDDIKLPPALDDWAKWNRIALHKGNSHIFLKLGTWILLRFRQLTKTPIDADVDGLLISDHPASFEMEDKADFNEALGMT
ncbi:hypothetical protein BDR03DRAFT_1019387, partial [Suillus americanus]